MEADNNAPSLGSRRHSVNTETETTATTTRTTRETEAKEGGAASVRV